MGWVSSFENVPSGRRRCYPMRKAIRPAALARAAGRPCVVADPRHVWKLPAREPGDLGDACSEHSRQAGGRRRKPYGPRARPRGVGQRYSTDESFEQKRETAGGERGGKAADQGEHPSAQHALDTERGWRVPRVGGCAQGSKGKEGEEVHRLASPFDSRIAPG